MRREINGRSLPVSADGICITGAHYFYSTVVLPNPIFESHQHKVETIQSHLQGRQTSPSVAQLSTLEG